MLKLLLSNGDYMNTFKTEQEKFWAGDFGEKYITRNRDKQLIASNTALFAKILPKSEKISSVFEIGPNIGLNLISLKSLLPHAEFTALEINENAVFQLKQLQFVDVIHDSILNYDSNKKYDFVFSKGVLIHINPESLQEVYEKMFELSNRYICIAEYYNPVPQEIDYRGHRNKLFKRDFAGELVEKYPELKIIDYGFVYHGDNQFPLDDITWFLLKK